MKGKESRVALGLLLAPLGGGCVHGRRSPRWQGKTIRDIRASVLLTVTPAYPAHMHVRARNPLLDSPVSTTYDYTRECEIMEIVRSHRWSGAGSLSLRDWNGPVDHSALAPAGESPAA